MPFPNRSLFFQCAELYGGSVCYSVPSRGKSLRSQGLTETKQASSPDSTTAALAMTATLVSARLFFFLFDGLFAFYRCLTIRFHPFNRLLLLLHSLAN